MLAFAVGVIVVLWQVHRAIERGAHEARTYMVASAAVSLLSYVVLTRMHERYMFLSLACLAPLVFVRRLRWSFAALSALFVLNLWFAFTLYNTQDNVQALHYEPVFDWIFGGFGSDTWQKRTISALAVTAIGLAVVSLGVRWIASAGRPGHEPPWPSGPRPGDTEPTSPTSAPACRAGGRLAALAEVLPRRPDRRTSLWALGARFAPLSLVGLACAFGLWVLHGETQPAQNLNDSSFHLQMVDWASAQIHEGRVPLDGWFPDLTLGSSFFHHYQSLAETLTAYAAYVTGASDQTAYLWIAVPAARALADLDLPRRAPARLEQVDRRPPQPSRRSSSARPATGTSTAATPGRATGCTRSCGRCGCCRSPGG